MWGASSQIALCGRKIKQSFTVPNAFKKFGLAGYCAGCKASALKRALKHDYTAIEDRGAASA